MHAIRTTLLVALAATVLIATGAAAGAVAAGSSTGIAPADGGVETLADAGPDGDASDDAGPPDELPGPVPEFVGDLLDAIDGFLSGALDDLGDAVSGIAGGSVGAIA